jgi:nitroreductase
VGVPHRTEHPEATGLDAVIGRQRAHRRFTGEPVEDEVVSELLDAAVHAPSAENRQPWEFVVVRDLEVRRRIGEITQSVWDDGARDLSVGRLAPELLDEVEAGVRGGVTGAPVVIVVCADLERGLRATVGSSIFPAVQNLLLAATARGLGSALTTLATARAGALAELLGLPRDVEPVAVVPIGHPTRPLGPARRDSFTDHTHRDRYGRPW